MLARILPHCFEGLSQQKKRKCLQLMRNSNSLKKNLTEDGKKLIDPKIMFLFYEAHEKLKPFDESS